MNLRDSIKSKPNEFIMLCKNHDVKSLYAFGSSITNGFKEDSSDIDLLIELNTIDPLKKGETLDTGKIKEAEEGLQFDESQTREIAKEVAKAVAMALKQDGMQIASAKILRLESMAFDTYFQYKDSTEDEFSFHIDQDRNIILSDFTFL
jgi:predicted nucleotidyltransferase